MADDDFDAEACVAAAAAAVGLPVPPELAAGVAENMRVTQRIARLVMDFELPDDVEAAPVFRP